MLASVNATLFSNDDINFAVTAFITGLVDFQIYDEVQAGQFCIDAKHLEAKLQKEHPISVFALLSLLRQCWLSHCVSFDSEPMQYIGQYLQFKA